MSGRTISDSEPTAFVDESLRPGDRGLYVVASVVITEDVERARIAVRKVPPKPRRFHWKDEQDSERYRMLDLLTELGCRATTYECQPCPTSKLERARAKCLETLLWDLTGLEVRQLVIESRGPAADRRDARCIGHTLRLGRTVPGLMYEHRRPSDEPALWLPDAVAGVAAYALEGRPAYQDRLGDLLIRNAVSL